MTSKSGTLSRLIGSTAGNTLPMAAAAMLLIASLVGGSVDISRAYLVRNRMQAACDAGILAGRKAIADSGYDEDAKATAEKYFKVNFDEANEGATGTEFTSDEVDGESGTVAGSVSSTIDTTVMKIFGINDIDLSVECTSALEIGNNDIMMVLDTTGSMAYTAAGYTPTSGQTSRLEDLQAGMISFYDTIAKAASSSNARIRFGFVPYSSAVNVGKLIRAANPDYMASTYPVQTRSWVKWGAATVTGTGNNYTAETLTSWQSGTTAFASSNACSAAIPPVSIWSNSGSPTSPNTETWTLDAAGNRLNTTVTSKQKQIKPVYQCRKSGRNYYLDTRNAERFQQTFTYSTQAPTYLTDPSQAYDGLVYRKSSYDVSDLLAGNTVDTLTGITKGGAPALVSSTWNGCIEERQTIAADSFSYDADKGITPATALDLDIDQAPGSDDATKWKPLWSSVAFLRSTDNPATSGSAAASACPAAAQLLSEMDRDDFTDYAETLTPIGQTYHDIGLIWGARLSSPTGIWKDNVNEAPSNGAKVSRHLIFMTDGGLLPNSTFFSSYGIESLDKRVTGGVSDPSQSSRHRSRFLAMCEAIKGKGIRLWVISFATSLSTDLQTCASSNSSYAATDATQLNAAFQNIAKQIGELRVTQ